MGQQYGGKYKWYNNKIYKLGDDKTNGATNGAKGAIAKYTNRAIAKNIQMGNIGIYFFKHLTSFYTNFYQFS